MPKGRSKIDPVTKRWMRSKADEMAVTHGCWFDEDAGLHVVEFIEHHMKHSIGEWAGQPFILLGWQRDDVVMPLFGWHRPDGTRRYRTAYIGVPKKAGKSTLSAAIALYMLVADGEAGAEVYSAATSRDQARIVFDQALNMVDASPSLRQRLEKVPSTKRILDLRTKSVYRALTAEANRNEGLNIHLLVMDEFHAQKTDAFWSALMYGGAARRQPLFLIITTAGLDQQSICFEYHAKAMQIQEGLLHDDSFFAYVCTAEWATREVPDDQVDAVLADPKVWKQANPSLGVTMSVEDFRHDFEAALQSPRLYNNFLRYRLNIWSQATSRWIPQAHWSACGQDYTAEGLRGQPCYGGLDLASVSDLCALTLFFPTCGNACLSWFWAPEARAKYLERRGEPYYIQWGREGHLILTPGEITDHGFIVSHILGLRDQLQMQGIAYDRADASMAVAALAREGLHMEPWGQGFISMSPPSKDLERMLGHRSLRHPNHPVLNWAAANVAVVEDNLENIRPVKPGREDKLKIDGIVALIMAIGLSGKQPIEESGSVYDQRGLQFV